MSYSSPQPHKIHRLLLDTHANFPPSPPTTSTPSTPSTSSPPNPRLATEAWSHTALASFALSLLPDLSAEERSKATRFYKPADAALSLGSSLLKHAAITRALPRNVVTWQTSQVMQERHIDNGKPYFEPGGVQFNASHHGQLVVLAYAVDGEGRGAEGTGEAKAKASRVGIDVVHVDMERGRRDVARAGGWRAWSSIFNEAFTPAEVEAIGRAMDSGASAGNGTDTGADIPDALLERALRTFYTYWSLKEAYIKMTSEAFMADWLRVLEFRNVSIPKTTTATEGGGEGKEEGGTWTQAEPIQDIEVWLRGTRLRDVYIEIQCVGKWYMVATAVGAPTATVERLEEILVQRDLVPLAEES